MADEGEYYSELMFQILQIVNDNPDIRNGNLREKLIKSDHVQTRYIGKAVSENMIIETKHGLHNIKTYRITDHGYEVLQAMLQLQAAVDGSGSGTMDYGASEKISD